jgi:hypothetical protein
MGSRAGQAWASIDLPEPGGPTISMVGTWRPQPPFPLLDILGHEKRGATMSVGLYPGGSSLEMKRAAIEKVSYAWTNP